MSQPSLFNFDNSYARLPERFYSETSINPVKTPSFVAVNRDLATSLNIDPDRLEHEGLEYLAGNRFPDNSKPLSQAYCGHQFGHLVPQLGDGRALLLGEQLNAQQQRFDIQLKGSGPTLFSRSGDGRSALGPVVREYLVSEAMHALGISTTRALAAVVTGEDVYRESLVPGGILTRVAKSHVRIGTFQYFAIRHDQEAVKILADYCIERHYPSLKHACKQEQRSGGKIYQDFFAAVTKVQIELVVDWMSVGFIHGVMNTDNTSIAGETIDYGPCAFMNTYNPLTVYSYIDSHGRYAYGNQKSILRWNLARFAECLLPLFGEDIDKNIAYSELQLEKFEDQFWKSWLDKFRHKLGLFDAEKEEDTNLIGDLLKLMQAHAMDFTLSFRDLANLINQEENTKTFHNTWQKPDLGRWLDKWRLRTTKQALPADQLRKRMNAVNPFVIPRNHHVQQAVDEAENEQDFSLMHKLNRLYSTPFQVSGDYSDFHLPPKAGEDITNTFCGT